MASPTPNKGYTYPLHGGAVNAWDTPLNTNFDQIDMNVGGVYPMALLSTASGVTYGSTNATFSSTVATLTLPSANAQNLAYYFTGTKTQNVSLVFPGDVGGLYNIWNNSTDAFNLTALTTVAGSSGVVIPSGYRMLVASDQTNLKQADNYLNSIIGTSGTKLTYADGANTYSGNSSYTGNNSHSGTELFTGAVTFSSAFSAVSVIGSVVATSATQETATSSNTVVTPLVQVNHPSALKAWASVTCSTVNGAQTIASGYKINSVSRSTIGTWTVTMTVTFSSSHYPISLGAFSGGFAPSLDVTSQSTNSFTCRCLNGSGALADPTKLYIMCAGDQ